MTTKLLSLEEILDNSPRELEVHGIGTIMVRDPTTRDRIDARNTAKKDPRWSEMKDDEKNALVLDFMAMSIIVEPKITSNDYYTANSIRLMNILNAVVIDYTNRYTELQDKRKAEIDAFLKRLKESNP